MKTILAAWRYVSARILMACLLSFGSSSISWASDNAPDSVDGTAAENKKHSPQTAEEWSPAKRALQKAMAGDPTSTSDELRREVKATDASFPIAKWSDITQVSAIAGWQRFLERSDLTKEQQVFAWWRIGSLYAYNFDPDRGEKANPKQAERAMKQVRKISPNLVSFETLNSATVYGSIEGPPNDRAKRLAEAFNWMAALSDKDVDISTSRINSAGYVIDKRLMSGGPPNHTIGERKQFLRKLLAEHREVLNKRITEEIRYSQDPAAIKLLLESIADSADKTIKEKWEEMARKK